ncbi:MAG: hypothetical protein AB1486_07495 [Planctomycetota bacterium]
MARRCLTPTRTRRSLESAASVAETLEKSEGVPETGDEVARGDGVGDKVRLDLNGSKLAPSSHSCGLRAG